MPERLEALLQSVVDRRVKADAEVRGRIDELSRERTTAEDKLRRLYRLVADGVAEPDDMLKERIARLKQTWIGRRAGADRESGGSRK
ncbi:MAG: Resolvase domain protein [Microvirga sp.]|nr:Resolvase domain protein [Microvirga sp.]